ncbi:MAG: phosphotransferase [Desulfobacteraceae bacterium]|nr:phosphotransferase [Desulfobacteraceae bacterium]MBC2754379.1 phosphotransferase [Desulfobacteraceae bacterium]
MITFEGLEENLKFIILEVENQVISLSRFIKHPSRNLYERIITKDDYIDNLKIIIENKCFSKIHSDKALRKKEINRIRSIQIICVNFERIADFCVNITRQMGYLSDVNLIRNYGYEEMIDAIKEGIAKVLPVLKAADLTGALAICKSELALDQMYKKNFDQLMFDVRKAYDPREPITILFIFRYLERIGDALLNIGEALIFYIIGEKIKIEQFQALQSTLDVAGIREPIHEIDFQSIWGTRSGCRIGRVEKKQRDDGVPDVQSSIFKEGTIKKISREKSNLERWQKTFSGLVADIYGYNEDGDNASLLVEYLPGCTLDEIILTSDTDPIDNILFVLKQTLSEVWCSTLEKKPVAMNYIQQIFDRWEDILRVHPDSHRASSVMGKKKISSSAELLKKCHQLERNISAPFSVLIHGDFNVSNVLYDHIQQRIHFIDLNRSREFDYIQDVSVFLISNFRIPVFEPVVRERLNHIIEDFFYYTRAFADDHKDNTFDIRMAFALVRSFYTSTRFELNFEFAMEMFLRAHFLMEKILDHRPKSMKSFKLPTEILFM